MLPVVDPVLLRFVVFAHTCVVLQLLAQKALFDILLVILLFVRLLVQFRIILLLLTSRHHHYVLDSMSNTYAAF